MTRPSAVEAIRRRIVEHSYVDRREDNLLNYGAVMDILDQVEQEAARPLPESTEASDKLRRWISTNATDPDASNLLRLLAIIEGGTRPLPEPQPDPQHTHDLRVGAREYENGEVRAWQVYCVICDQSGRIVLPDRPDPYDEPDHRFLYPDRPEPLNVERLRTALKEQHALLMPDVPPMSEKMLDHIVKDLADRYHRLSQPPDPATAHEVKR